MSRIHARTILVSAVKAASHTNKMAAAVKPLTTAKPKRAAIRPTEERAKAPTEMRVLLTWTGIFLELIRRTTRSLTWRSPALRGFIAQRPVDRRVMHQLIHIARLANSPIRRLIFACPIAIPTLVNVNVCIGELDQISKTSAM